MPDLLDPKNDYVFKRLFADAPDLLLALINALRPAAPPLTALTVLNPTIDPAELQGKYIVLDLRAVDRDGGQFNVEMQVRRHRAWGARGTYYLARMVSGQLAAGEDYTELKPVVGVHLLDFDLFPEHPEQALWCFEMRDATRPTVRLGAELALHIIELRKADRLGQASGPLAAWIELFEHWREEAVMNQINDEAVRAAYAKLQDLSADAEARRLAFVRERALRDERSLLRDAREEGREEGRAEGHAAGERASARRTASRLIAQTTLDDAAIAAATGLPAAEISVLRRAPD